MSIYFYKMFCFSGKHIKNVKLSFTNIFQKLFFTLLALVVSKTFLFFLAFVLACFEKFIKLLLLACALFFFSLKAYKTLIACLLRRFIKLLKVSFACLLYLA